MIPIDKGIPLPANHLRYPFHKMEPGDSFFIEGNGISTERLKQWVANTTSNWKQRKAPAWRFTIRVEGDGVRVRRTE